MNRSTSTTVAAILVFAIGVAGMISAVRILSAGIEGLPPVPELGGAGGPPFWAGLLFMVLAVASLFAAFGLWKNQKWGKVVAIVTCTIFGLFTLGDVLGSVMARQYAFASGFGLLLGACVLAIILVLRREPRPQAA